MSRNIIVVPHSHWLRARPIIAYLQIRNSRWLLTAMLAIGVVVWSWGTFETSIPAATDTGGAKIEFWRLLAVGSASLPALTVTSQMEALEVAGGFPYFKLRRGILGGAFAISSGCILVAVAVGIDSALVPLVARALFAWFGLALISGRLLGWNYSWILPIGALCVLLYWGHGSGGGYQWWEFTAQPATHLPSLIFAITLFVAGVLACSLTPWRLNRTRRVVSRMVADVGVHFSRN